MTTLITGGTGFLGRHLIDQLIKNGQKDLRIFGRTPEPELMELGVEFVPGSLLNPGDVARALDGVTAIYHLAGRVERDRKRAHLMYALHVDGTRNLLDQTRKHAPKVKKIIVASTSGTVGVGTTKDFIADDNSPFAENIVKGWPYYLSKIYAERLCQEYVERYQMPIVLMRPTLLLGPGDRRESSTGDVVLFLKKKVPGVIEGGLSFVDVRDVAKTFIAAMDRGEPGETFLLGAANLTLQDFFQRLADITGLPAPKLPIPDGLVRLGSRFLSRINDLSGKSGELDPVSLEMARHYWYIDSTHAKNRLGFAPRDPNTTLRDTVNWIKEHHPEFQEGPGPRQDPPPEFVPPETVEFARKLREQARQ